MKRVSWLVICLLVTGIVYAQIQQGYVKTKGRLGSNGTVIAGTRLSGATVAVKGGNAVVSGSNGTFSLSVPNNNYFLQNVQKQGYVLTDPDVLSKQYAWSKNPLILVLETPSQQIDDKLAAERKIRRTLQRQLQNKEDEIELLKEQQKLSEEEYRKQLQEIYAQQESDENLIGEMADRYSRMDFDEVDEFNRRISNLILEGKLTEADSLLNTKGDIKSRAATFRLHQEANVQAEQEIKKKQEKLEKSKAMTQKELEDLAQDCYSKFEIFKMQHQNDSAGYYIELRASLDTAKVEWLLEAGSFVNNYSTNYLNARLLYEHALQEALNQQGELNQYTSASYTGLGSVYDNLGNFERSLEFYQKALAIDVTLFGFESPYVAVSYNNIGCVYENHGEYEKALEYILKALAIRERTLETEASDLATSYNNAGCIYNRQGDYAKALYYFEKALDIRLKLWGTDHPEVAVLYNNIGGNYDSRNNFDKALEYFSKSLVIRKKIFGENHPILAVSYNNVGAVYYSQGNYDKAEEYYRKALDIDKKVFGEKHPDVAMAYNNLGLVFKKQHNYTKALEYYFRSLAIKEKILGTENLELAISYNNVGQVYKVQGDYIKALEYMNKSVAIFEKILGSNHSYTKTVQQNIEDVKKAMGYE